MSGEKCSYCGKPITKGQSSMSIEYDGKKISFCMGGCFEGYSKELIQNIKAGNRRQAEKGK